MAESNFILGLNPWSSNQIMNHFPDPIHRILLIRLSALGDCFCAFPVFAALRTHFPHAHIAWAIQDNFAPLIQNLPGLDEIILFPRQRWKRSSWFTQLTEGRQLIRRLGMRRFDLTIDVQSNTKSGAVAWATRAPLRICHGGEEAKELTQWLNNKPIPPSAEMPHIIQRNLHLLSPLGIPEASPRFPLPPDPFAKATVRRWLEEKGLRPGEYFLLTPFCGNQNKEWPPEQFTRLSQILAQHNQATVFLNGPGKEAE
ncbi:MAG: glycosyltransferase family 9 protein, partial [bacterium]|nr:glycosyltransferase family 9 protein [bacterium]